MCSLPMARYFVIKDAEQKTLYLKNDQLLVGEPNSELCGAEKVCVLPNRSLDRTKFPIIMGIQDGTRCLACVDSREGPLLQVEDVNIEDLYKGGEEATRFTFLQEQLGPYLPARGSRLARLVPGGSNRAPRTSQTHQRE